jgi:protein O-GlcNAc transferase
MGRSDQLLPKLITPSLEHYEQAAWTARSATPDRAAAETAGRPSGLSAVRSAELSGNFEAAHARMWQTSLSGERAAAFSIESM